MKREKLTYLTVRNKLKETKVSIFTPVLFRQIFQVSPHRVKYFLETYTKKGLFLRLKQGTYAFLDRAPTEEEIANALYHPSYISFEYAMSRYGIIPETVYIISSATTKPTRFFEVANIGYSYFKMKREAYTGYRLHKNQFGERSSHVLLAEPEKALVDYLYFVSLGRKTLNDRLELRNLDRKKIQRYAELFQNKKLTKLIEKIYD